MKAGIGAVELLSFRFHLPQCDLSIPSNFAKRSAEIEFLKEFEINLFARAIQKAYFGE